MHSEYSRIISENHQQQQLLRGENFDGDVYTDVK